MDEGQGNLPHHWEYGLSSPSWAQRKFNISTEVKQHQKMGYFIRAACPK